MNIQLINCVVAIIDKVAITVQEVVLLFWLFIGIKDCTRKEKIEAGL